jgi:hypothetical protein
MMEERIGTYEAGAIREINQGWRPYQPPMMQENNGSESLHHQDQAAS